VWTALVLAILTVSIFVAWDGAVAQTKLDQEKAAVRMTLDTVFEGWRRLDISLYMRVWDRGAVQYLRKGATRNYNQILADRIEAFAKYRRVDASWTADSIEINGDKAYVVARYSMTLYRNDGKTITENEKEFYVLEKKADMMWYIVENYDYLPRQ
jgi:ketosteroid isomerase-like protein